MASFLVVIEKGQHSYGAYSPDLPGCVAVGDTVEEVEQRMREAIHLYLEGMREDHLPLPQPTSQQANSLEIRPALARKSKEHDRPSAV